MGTDAVVQIGSVGSSRRKGNRLRDFTPFVEKDAIRYRTDLCSCCSRYNLYVALFRGDANCCTPSLGASVRPSVRHSKVAGSQKGESVALLMVARRTNTHTHHRLESRRNFTFSEDTTLDTCNTLG